jgi:cytochrome b subunit of formate dehydrogenase
MTETDVPPSDGVYVRRFDNYDRALHGLLMTSFLGLSFTGIPLLFAGTRWAGWLSRLMGGFHVAGILHRTFAGAMVLTFFLHLLRIFKRLFVEKQYSILWGPDSIVPQPKDIRQLVQHVRWFFGRGPRPEFDHFTYWEKFDYWAVFWGMAIIGGSGFVLWFPRLWARLLPGRFFNVALLIHGEEALLAVVFIFTIHFFNGHLRPEKFPMDTVIFSGVLPLDEIEQDRPAEYERLVAEGEITRITVPTPRPALFRRARVVGSIAVSLGLLLVVLTIAALVF